jgi:hypothetical protein
VVGFGGEKDIRYNHSQDFIELTMTTPLLPTLHNLPATLPLEGAISIELQEGIPIFRASNIVQNRIEALLAKQENYSLNPEEEQELDGYEEIDDYLSFLNRVARNLLQNPNNQTV